MTSEYITVPDPDGPHLMPIYDGALASVNLEPGLYRCVTEAGDEKALWVTAAGKVGLAPVAAVEAGAVSYAAAARWGMP